MTFRGQLAADLEADWLAWENRPGAEHTAARMEETCCQVAGHLGVTATPVRVWLAEALHRGESHTAAVASLLADDLAGR